VLVTQPRCRPVAQVKAKATRGQEGCLELQLRQEVPGHQL
jgi:hypothetical protein